MVFSCSAQRISSVVKRSGVSIIRWFLCAGGGAFYALVQTCVKAVAFAMFAFDKTAAVCRE
jgi:hypothetical protein